MELPLERMISIGIVTDLHWNQTLATRLNRYYTHSLDKLKDAVATFNQRHVDFAVNLGDTLDSIREDSIDLQQLLEVHHRCDAPWIHVLGNHDADICGEPVERKVFIRTFGMPASYYSFHRDGLHWVVLDGNFAENGCDWAPSWDRTWVGETQLEWLQHTLEASPASPTVVLVHQLVCPPGDQDESEAGVSLRDAEQLRKILESAGNVLAVFSGHHHAGDYQYIQAGDYQYIQAGDYQYIQGIHYIGFKAMVKDPPPHNSYAIVTVEVDGKIRIEGFGEEISRTLSIRRPVSDPQVKNSCQDRILQD